ncbi:alpha/beta fold hydrolase [Streptomyces sudanensis]|uniref:alpha/beta fold hydrolase n=1 Tax=Streptomyces sudanensis TaxID=436397 RepID=UPI0020CF862C|nr:alpha/beta fold hydrolase [Streptomyces sudanensis]MCP9959461.1 TMEM53 family protein [Streptomyces sudanensis]MCQ0000092.1 TMEM53 family protein [Streptomyces sudanensis]
MRSATAAAVAATVIGAGTAAVAAGRYASGTALRPRPGRPLPGEPRLTVHAADPDRITLTRDLSSLRPGVYGVEGPGVHAVVGPVLDDAPHAPDTVVRRLERVDYGTLATGTRVRLTPQVHSGTPATALGVPYREVEVAGELGPLPAWYVPGSRTTWVITAHGLGATREHPLNVLGLLHGRFRLPVLDLAYRGDPGAPRSADGLGHLGDSEWRDLDAAVHHAVRNGATGVVLHGWSTGAAMALRTARRSRLRDMITGLVLDSPVLDWEAALRALAVARRVPAVLLPLAVRAAQGRTGLRRGEPARTVATEAPDVPALVFHGPGDTVAPWAASRALAERRPDLVTLRAVHDAPHAAMWNADPERYEEAMRRFLIPLL